MRETGTLFFNDGDAAVSLFKSFKVHIHRCYLRFVILVSFYLSRKISDILEQPLLFGTSLSATSGATAVTAAAAAAAAAETAVTAETAAVLSMDLNTSLWHAILSCPHLLASYRLATAAAATATSAVASSAAAVQGANTAVFAPHRLKPAVVSGTRSGFKEGAGIAQLPDKNDGEGYDKSVSAIHTLYGMCDGLKHATQDKWNLHTDFLNLLVSHIGRVVSWSFF
jgi:hypothetical protein